MEPVDRFTLLSIISKADERSAQKAKELFESEQKEIKTKQAKLRAIEKLKNDPKQTVDKPLAKSYWDRWQADKTLYRSKAEFARDMLEKCPNMTSQKVIEDWCRRWEKEQ